LIGDIIVSWGESGLTNDIEMASASALSLVLSLLMLGAYGAYILFYKVVWKRIKLKRGAKNE
jgi:hypothetical protein